MFWISIIFFLSGLSALVYQLLWMRHLGFIFGNTVYASATVLTAFMGGLAIGSHIFGRWSERLKNPIRWFAGLEFAVAAYALAMPFMFDMIKVIYMLAFQHVSENMIFLTTLRFVLAALILLFPTICMGGTLPVLIRGMAHDDAGFGRRLGWLYGVNTLGAVVGVFISGFYLIPVIGLTNTNILAVATDFISGMGALLLARRHVVPIVERENIRTRYHWSTFSSSARIALALAILCGFVSLSLEVIWFRALILVFGSTTYSFTVMLGVFLLGIGVGSLMIAPLLDRVRSLVGVLAASVAIIGIYTLWSMYRFDAGPEFLVDYLNRHGFSWEGMNQARFMIAVSHLAVPALLFGAAFTAATRIVRHESGSSSGATGLVYALNTLGAVAGSFIAGFLMLPRFGMEKSLIILAMLMLLSGGAILTIWGRSAVVRLAAFAITLAVVVYALFFPPVWNKSMLSAGAYFGPFNFIRDGRNVLREMVMSDRLLHYHESLSSTVSVHIGDNEEKYFCVDGKTEADQSPRSMVLQRMIGHLPLLFHPNAKSGVNIGLGAGVSFGALGQHPLDHLEVVEINPAVQYATRVWGKLNHNILDNPRAIVTINDGRNHLFSSSNTYDIITADPFEPVMAGAAHLYTVDYFRLAYDRLNPDGIMGQYLPLYEMSLEDYLTIVRSFVEVFPNTALFFTGFDTILIGFKGDMNMNADVLRKNFHIPEVEASLAGIGFTTPEMILGMFVADLSQHKEFVGSGPLNTDEYPIIEYNTPKSALRYTTDENQQALLANFTPIPDAWLEGLDEATANQLKKEHEAVRLMLEAAVLRGKNDTEGAFKLLAQALEISPDNPVVKNEMVAMLVVSAQTLRKAGDLDEAARQFQTALQLDPNDFWSLYYLIELGMRANQVEYAGQVLQEALTRYPESPLMIGQRGKYLFSTGQQKEGFADMKKALELQPGNRGLWTDLMTLATAANDQLLASYAQQRLDELNAYIEGGH
jgi:spermidine synthase